MRYQNHSALDKRLCLACRQYLPRVLDHRSCQARALFLSGSVRLMRLNKMSSPNAPFTAAAASLISVSVKECHGDSCRGERVIESPLPVSFDRSLPKQRRLKLLELDLSPWCYLLIFFLSRQCAVYSGIWFLRTPNETSRLSSDKLLPLSSRRLLK